MAILSEGSENAQNAGILTVVFREVFGHSYFGQGERMKAGIYARVSTQDQQTLPLQLKTIRAYVKKRKWKLTLEIKEVGSGATHRAQREEPLKAARRREIEVIIVWRLDRWGRSLADLMVTLKELHDLNVGLVSLTEALDLTTSSGRAMAGMLAVFAEFERGKSSASGSKPDSPKLALMERYWGDHLLRRRKKRK
ncbi:MAG: recombinase family protein [Thermodesulfobacteriota bacterium]